MTTSPDTLERIVAELREYSESKIGKLLGLGEIANRLEKLSAASVRVTDEMVNAAWDSLDDRSFHPITKVDLRIAIEAALRLSPQGEDHGR